MLNDSCAVEFKMLNVKRRCKFNLNANEDLYFNNNNNNNNNISIKHEKDVQKFCLQHNNCNCSTPEVCISITMPHNGIP